jgi:poly(3-hydroxybutyrate) depolymerase
MRAPLFVVLAACSTHDDPIDPIDPSPDAPASGVAPVIPMPTGTCPALTGGDVTFAPAGVPPRTVTLTLDDAASAGPLIIYWHATGSAPLEAGYSLGDTADAFTAAGGVIAAPAADPSAGTFEWFVVNGSAKLDDFAIADEIVGCFAQAGRVDPARIHSMGMSAGALQTTALSFARAGYIASVATYSGGMPDGFSPVNTNPDNKFAALIFDGGASDNVFGVDFEAASQHYQATLDAAGHFTAICDHGQGHEIPLDAAPSVVQFFHDNPFGAWPSPYASGLPATFPAYCR